MMAVALAVWMVTALVGTIIVEVVVLKQPWQLIQLFYMALILVGIIG